MSFKKQLTITGLQERQHFGVHGRIFYLLYQLSRLRDEVGMLLGGMTLGVLWLYRLVLAVRTLVHSEAKQKLTKYYQKPPTYM